MTGTQKTKQELENELLALQKSNKELVEELRLAELRSQQQAQQQQQPPTAPTTSNGSAALTEFQAFPVMVDEVDIGGTSGRRGGGRAGWQSGQIVESALKDVLGWRPRSADPRGFVAALTQSFTWTEVAGHTECTWTPRSYAASIQADLGALTGAQAAIYQQVKLLADAALPILERLMPLRPDPDAENITALRSIVRSRLNEIPAELGAEGGPRVQRVDDLFERLRGPDQTPGGELGLLGKRLGMSREFANTLDEETGLTEFLVLTGHVETTFGIWTSQRRFFDRLESNTVPDDRPFLGTQLVLLSRQLEVVAETVGESYFAMDSVFLGAAERQTVELQFPAVDQLPQESPLTVAELLDWVERFATEEGPRLITDGGVDGVQAFAPTVERLATLVRRARLQPDGQQDPARMPPSYATARVRQALAQLQQQLESASKLARPFTNITRP